MCRPRYYRAFSVALWDSRGSKENALRCHTEVCRPNGHKYITLSVQGPPDLYVYGIGLLHFRLPDDRQDIGVICNVFICPFFIFPNSVQFFHSVYFFFANVGLFGVAFHRVRVLKYLRIDLTHP